MNLATGYYVCTAQGIHSGFYVIRANCCTVFERLHQSIFSGGKVNATVTGERSFIVAVFLMCSENTFRMCPSAVDF